MVDFFSVDADDARVGRGFDHVVVDHGQQRLDLGIGSLDGDDGLDVAGYRRDRCGEEGSGIAARDLAGREAAAGQLGGAQPVDSEGPPVVAAKVERDEIPATLGGDELMRFDEAVAALAVTPSVVEADLLAVAARNGEDAECVGVDVGVGAGPAQFDHAGVQCRDSAPQSVGKELLDLRQGAQRGVFDAADGGACRRAQPESDRDGFVVIEDERWQMRADGKAVSPVGPRGGVDGIAEGAEPVHIAPHRAFGDLQALGEFCGPPQPMGLQERQQVQRPAGRIVRHLLRLPRLADRCCPQWFVR